MITKVTLYGKEYIIEYEDIPVKYTDAWKPCGNGTWLYDEIDKTLCRNSIGFSYELPYHFDPNEWNPKGRFHLVLASNNPLWVWWGKGCFELKWGDSGIALPKLEIYKCH